MFPGDDFSDGLAINNRGQVVGDSYSSAKSEPPKAFVYNNGQMSDLNTLIDASLGVELNFATAINDKGQIVANGQIKSGGYRSFLLTPVPEPRTLALLPIRCNGRIADALDN